MAFVDPNEMTQDWSTPLTPDVLDSVVDFCVYCGDEECAKALWQLLMQRREHGCGVSPTFNQDNWWSPRIPCYRFEDGVARKHDSIETYEQEIEWRRLPKYTFYAGGDALPDIEIPEDIGILVW